MVSVSTPVDTSHVWVSIRILSLSSALWRSNIKLLVMAVTSLCLPRYVHAIATWLTADKIVWVHTSTLGPRRRTTHGTIARPLGTTLWLWKALKVAIPTWLLLTNTLRIMLVNTAMVAPHKTHCFQATTTTLLTTANTLVWALLTSLCTGTSVLH